MENNDHTGMYIAIIGLGLSIWFVRAYILPMIQLNDQKRQYQSIAEPQLLCQVNETNDEFYALIEREKARFIDTKNRWAQKQTPVIAMWRNRAFSITWFGKNYDVNTVGMSQMDYHRNCFETYKMLYADWSRETGRFGDQAVAHANGQKPFNHTEIWNQN